jgi:uncharacterized protein YfdQ (DUF2303 family)
MNQQSTPPALQATAATPESLQVAEQLITLAGAVLAPQEIEGAHFVTLPPNYTHREVTDQVEKAQPAPNRKRGTVQVKDVDSLLRYLADQENAGDAVSAYVYADPDTRTMTAVFNDNRAGAGWRDHRAVFKAEFTPEFETWKRNDKQPKDQGSFAEFIEDNFADIQAPAAATLLEMATTIQATTGINFASAKRLQDGQVQLQYTETIEARAGASGALQIPKEFTLGMRIFKNGGGYLLQARLKYRLAGGGVKFWYELDRPERAVEDAFKGYIDQVRDKSGYAVLIGAAG